MSGSTLRRSVLFILVITLVLPLASAYAAPAKRSDMGNQGIQLTDWSRTLLQSVNDLLSLLRPMIEQDDFMPPGQKPGNDSVNREGNGLDPHGRP